ncbi:hypothetical protein H4R34_001352 [Dimargaris verticillata]|uniref:Cullin family profile domain-containing protein n=1 Tax=Dimargaris verticillata TaxID=2761393 RepID=A0A9W8EB10_9FUNG|nr:hypothetical protein H4R34_001352 [Dimargaris verticillata]
MSNTVKLGTSLMPQDPVSKVTFQGFKNPITLPDGYTASTLNRLMAAVKALLHQAPVHESLEELYRACENLCHNQCAQDLYDHLKQEFSTYVAQRFDQLSIDLESGRETLDLVYQLWTDYGTQMHLIRNVFLYLDRTYVLQTSPLLGLWELALDLYRQQWLQHTPVRNQTLEALLTTLRSVRDGQTIDQSRVASVIQMYIDLTIYPTGFEFAFLQSTQEYYRLESERMMATITEPSAALADRAQRVAQYLHHVDQRLRTEEEDLAVRLLHQNTLKPLMDVLCTELLTSHVDTLLNQGLAELLRSHQVEHLRRLFALLNRVDQLDKLRAAMGRYIEETGRAIVSDMAHEDRMVEQLIGLKKQQDEVLQQCFENHAQFAETLRSSFEHLINSRPTKPSQLIAKFIDGILRTGAKPTVKTDTSNSVSASASGTSDDQLEQTLTYALTLFRYLQGKDVFEAFYKRDLARRLLLNKSVSLDAEKSMLIKLRTECGADFTHKLEGMLRDMETSQDLMAGFSMPLVSDRSDTDGGGASGKRGRRSAIKKQRGKRLVSSDDEASEDERSKSSAASAKQAGTDKDLSSFHAVVLTQSYWPTYPPGEPVMLPPVVTRYQNAYQEYYLAKHEHRNLQWHNTLATCVLRAIFPTGRKELVLSCYQALVLLALDQAETVSMTFVDLQAATGIKDDQELAHTLHPLVYGKNKVLRKYPAEEASGSGQQAGGTAGDILPSKNESFGLNETFTSPLYRIKLNTWQMKETPSEAQVTTEKVFQDRQYQVDAAIVRIMKAHKSMSHSQLVSELFKLLKFPMTTQELKKRVDSLIDRDYVERDAQDSTVYHYMS